MAYEDPGGFFLPSLPTPSLSFLLVDRLCVTPQTAAHQAPLSLGFSRQEHWSGLPFPPPKQESESESEVAQSCPTLSDPMDCSPPGSSVHVILQARILEWVVRRRRGQGPHLAKRWEPRGFSRVAAAFSSYDGDLSLPLGLALALSSRGSLVLLHFPL